MLVEDWRPGLDATLQAGAGRSKEALWPFGLHQLHVPGVRWQRAKREARDTFPIPISLPGK